jgi:DNA-directed RNA polymerase alpha subunit
MTAPDPRQMTVHDLIPQGGRMGTATANCIHREGIWTAGELAELTEADLLDIRNFGPVSLAVVKAALAEHGLSLREEP